MKLSISNQHNKSTKDVLHCDTKGPSLPSSGYLILFWSRKRGKIQTQNLHKILKVIYVVMEKLSQIRLSFYVFSQFVDNQLLQGSKIKATPIQAIIAQQRRFKSQVTMTDSLHGTHTCVLSDYTRPPLLSFSRSGFSVAAYGDGRPNGESKEKSQEH